MSNTIEVIGGALTITRIFDAPRDIVFDVWTDPEKVKKWSGCPDGATLITVDFTDLGDKTEVCLVQSGLAGDDMKNAVQEGWGSAFEKLAGAVDGARQGA